MAQDLAQMVLEVRKNPKPTQFYMLNNLSFDNILKKSSPRGVLALGLLMAVYGPGLSPDGPGGPEKPQTNPVLHAEQPLFQQLSPKADSWGCPGSGPPRTCWRPQR